MVRGGSPCTPTYVLVNGISLGGGRPEASSKWMRGGMVATDLFHGLQLKTSHRPAGIGCDAHGRKWRDRQCVFE